MGPRRDVRDLAAYGFGVLGLAALLAASWQLTGSRGFAFDFTAYYEAAQRVAAGQTLYTEGSGISFDPSRIDEAFYVYPPPLAVAMLPLFALPLQAAAIAWLVLKLGLLVGAIAAMPFSARARAATLGVAGFSFPVYSDLNLGNVSIVVLALLVAAWRFRDRAPAGVALAVAGWLRYSTALVGLWWLLRRRVGVVGAAVAGTLVIALATLPFVGVRGWTDYVATIGAMPPVTTGPHNLSLVTTAEALGIHGPTWPWVALQLGIALGATMWAARSADRDRAMAVAIAATVLFYPFLHSHYLVLLLVPAAFLASRGLWWGLALPLLAWLPSEVHPIVATLGVIAPFAVRGREPSADPAMEERDPEQVPGHP